MSSRLFRTALEGVEEGAGEQQVPVNAEATTTPEEETIVMKGPLAEIFTRALNIAYAKDDAVTGEAALESQALDAQIAQKLHEALRSEGNMSSPALTVYGVNQAEVTADTIVEVSQDLVERDENTSDYVIVIDATAPGANGEVVSTPQETIKMISALECLVEAHGGEVYRSFKDFVNSCK